eukprot:7938647-Karenia_brevis.AAC.1
MDAVPMSIDDEIRRSVEAAIESAAQASNSARIITESTQRNQNALVQKYKKFYNTDEQPWPALYGKHLDFVATMMPSNEQIDYDSCSYAEFYAKIDK